MIVFAIFTKFGALFLTIPDPVIGGTFFVLFGMSIITALLIFKLLLHKFYVIHNNNNDDNDNNTQDNVYGVVISHFKSSPGSSGR